MDENTAIDPANNEAPAEDNNLPDQNNEEDSAPATVPEEPSAQANEDTNNIPTENSDISSAPASEPPAPAEVPAPAPDAPSGE
jgi:hypothetical protein